MAARFEIGSEPTARAPATSRVAIPAETWPEETADHAARGFTATKYRIGRHPIAHEGPRSSGASPQTTWTWRSWRTATRHTTSRSHPGGQLDELGFRWLEEPMPPAAATPP
ncbi:MAG: hypothetical protein R3C32_04095 [Chloroflexota bacterium]